MDGINMRVLMGVIKGPNGVYCARKKVPKGLEEAVAIAIGSDKARLSCAEECKKISA